MRKTGEDLGGKPPRAQIVEALELIVCRQQEFPVDSRPYNNYRLNMPSGLRYVALKALFVSHTYCWNCKQQALCRFNNSSLQEHCCDNRVN